MKKETGILIAAGIGFLAIFGVLGLRRFLNSKHTEYHDYYSDFHRLFDRKISDEEHHGVEFLSVN